MVLLYLSLIKIAGVDNFIINITVTGIFEIRNNSIKIVVKFVIVKLDTSTMNKNN